MTCVAAIAMRVAIWTARSVSTVVGGLGDEDHVDVADVVELARAGLAHRDDRQRCRGDLVRREGHLAPGHVDGDVERRAGQVGEPRGDRRERLRRGRVQHVVERDLRQVAAVADPQAHPGGLVDGAVDGLGQGLGVLGLGPRLGDRGEEQVEFGGAALQELAEPHRGAEQPHHPLGGRLVVEDRPQGVTVGLHQALEPAQRTVRVGGRRPQGRPRADGHRQVGPEPRLERGQPLETLRELGEPQPRQFGAGLFVLPVIVRRVPAQRVPWGYSIPRLVSSSNGVTWAR